jgi:hypothetical protein
MVMQINVPKMEVIKKMKLDVNVNIIPSVEIVICVIQRTMMHHGNLLELSMRIHAKV